MSVNGILTFKAPASAGIVPVPHTGLSGGTALKEAINLTTGAAVALPTVVAPFAPDSEEVFYTAGATAGDLIMVTF